MQLIERNQCMVCGESDLEELFVFKKFPMFMGTTLQKEEDDIKVDMSFMICKSCGMIQLHKLVPLENLYEKSHNSSIGEIWKKHHMEFANFINKFAIKSVFEIGGGNGRLEIYYNSDKKKPIEWTIIEPTPVEPLVGCSAKYIQDFWGEDYQLPEKYDLNTLVHSHVLEHIYNPITFMKKCSGLLEDGKYMIFSLPNLAETLKRKYTNALNFEHSYFITEPYIEWLMSKNHFEILEKKYFCEDHSIFYAVRKNSRIFEKSLLPNLYETNKEIFLEYINYHKELIKEYNKKVKLTGKKIYLFGAHIFSQYLIEFGLDTSNIVAVLDNDLMKQGKRLYGTRIYVESPKVLKDIDKPIVILKVGNYVEEIKKDIIENINSRTEFWE